MDRDAFGDIVRDTAGWYPGRMISHSKSAYLRRHRGNNVMFNAYLYVRVGGTWRQMWCGDVDVTADAQALTRIAEAVFPLRLGIVVESAGSGFSPVTDATFDGRDGVLLEP